jgi:glyoxylase-like metal-dependent hydrolase (beta-lactamase superfamily II)
MSQMTTPDVTFPLGAFRCTLIFDSVLLVKPELVLPADQRGAWPRLELDEQGLIITPVYCLLVDTGSQRVLIDAGNGARPDRPIANQGTLPEHLKRIGISPADIDVVVLTHSHLDHVGGLLTAASNGAQLAYLRGRHVITRLEWDYLAAQARGGRATPGADRALAVLSAVNDAGALQLVDTGVEVVPGIWLRHAPGHTPGNVVVVVESDARSLTFLGDTFHHTGQIARPSLVSPGDEARDVVPKTRHTIIYDTLRTSALVAASHFAYPSVGHLEGTADQATFVPLGTIPR